MRGLCGSRCHPHSGIRFAHDNTHPPLPACSFSVHYRSHLTTKSIRSLPMPCKLCTTSYHNTSQHIPPYPHSQELFQYLFPCLASPTLFHLSKSHAPLRMYFDLRVEFLLKTNSGYPRDAEVTLFTLANLSIPSALTPIGQLH